MSPEALKRVLRPGRQTTISAGTIRGNMVFSQGISSIGAHREIHSSRKTVEQSQRKYFKVSVFLVFLVLALRAP